MSGHAANLGRAGRLLRRIADISSPSEFEGVPMSDIIADVLLAQNDAYMRHALNRTYACDVDESAGMAEAFERGRQAREAYDEAEKLSNVIELHSYGKCVK